MFPPPPSWPDHPSPHLPPTHPPTNPPLSSVVLKQLKMLDALISSVSSEGALYVMMYFWTGLRQRNFFRFWALMPIFMHFHFDWHLHMSIDDDWYGTDKWPICDWYMTDIWLINDWYMTDIWLICYWFMTDIWQIYNWYTTYIWQIYDLYMTDVLLIYDWYTNYIWIIMTDILLTYMRTYDWDMTDADRQGHIIYLCETRDILIEGQH